MYKTMKQIILIAIGLISLLPVSAQVLSNEERAKMRNNLGNLALEGQRKHREEVMAKQRKEQQRAAEVENRTQLGLQKNKQQVQRLQEDYGVDDLRQRNGENRPERRNIQKTQTEGMRHSTPTGNDVTQAKGYGPNDDDMRHYPDGQRPSVPEVSRAPRVPTDQVPSRKQSVVYHAPLGQFPPESTIGKANPQSTFKPSVEPVEPINPGQPARPVEPMSKEDFFCPKNKYVENIAWRDIKPGLCTKDVGITRAVMLYNNDLMYNVGFVNGKFSTQGGEQLIVEKRGDYYLVKSVTTQHP